MYSVRTFFEKLHRTGLFPLGRVMLSRIPRNTILSMPFTFFSSSSSVYFPIICPLIPPPFTFCKLLLIYALLISGIKIHSLEAQVRQFVYGVAQKRAKAGLPYATGGPLLLDAAQAGNMEGSEFESENALLRWEKFISFLFMCFTVAISTFSSLTLLTYYSFPLAYMI